jgi:hypothetical protein
MAYAKCQNGETPFSTPADLRNDESPPFAAVSSRILILCNEEALARWTKM